MELYIIDINIIIIFFLLFSILLITLRFFSEYNCYEFRTTAIVVEMRGSILRNLIETKIALH